MRTAVLACLLAAAAACGGVTGHGRDPGSADDTAQLPAAQVAADVALLEAALTEAWAGRVFKTGATWDAFLTELRAIPAQRHTERSFCIAISDALTRLTDPSLFAMPEVGERCGHEATAGGLPFRPDDAGMNVAVESDRAYAYFAADASGVAILGVRELVPPGEAWSGFEAAVAELASAQAIVVDLRNAHGDDPRGALPLVHALAGVAPVRPLARIEIREGERADALRRAYREWAPGVAVRDAEAWRGLVGEETPLVERRDPDAAPIVVLVGGPCNAGCELIARSLQSYAGAKILGRVGSGKRLASDDLGLLVLAGGLRVYIPTAAYVLNPGIERAGGLPGGWHQAHGLGEPRSYDGLGTALAELRPLLRWRAEERHWLGAEPPACASFTPVESVEQLPEEARKRWQSPGLVGERGSFYALLYLSPERAQAYVSSCPGLTAGWTIAHRDSTRSAMVELRFDSFASLSRLAQSPAVAQIWFEHEHEVHPTGTGE